MTRAETNRQLRGRAARVRRALSTVTREHVRFGLIEGHPLGGWLRASADVRRPPGGERFRLEIREILGDRGRSLDLVAYKYTLLTLPTEQEVFGYHLHGPPVTWPHFHLGAGAGELAAAVAESHFPAVLDDIEEIVAMPIRDMKVAPLREDWPRLLGDER